MTGTCAKHGTATKHDVCMVCLIFDSPVTKVPVPFAMGKSVHGKPSFFAKPVTGA